MPQRDEQVRDCQVFPSPAAEVNVWTVPALVQPVWAFLSLYFFWFWHFVTSRLKYAAGLFLLFAARSVFVFALGHFLLANLPHEVEEHLRGGGGGDRELSLNSGNRKVEADTGKLPPGRKNRGEDVFLQDGHFLTALKMLHWSWSWERREQGGGWVLLLDASSALQQTFVNILKAQTITLLIIINI